MKKIIKILRLKWIEYRLLLAYKNAVIEAKANDIKYQTNIWRDRPFFQEVERLLKKWHKVRYDN